MKCAVFEVQLPCGFQRFTSSVQWFMLNMAFGKCSTQMPYDHTAHPLSEAIDFCEA